MIARVDHIAGHTFHGRKGAVQNAFRYSIDYVLLDAEASVKTPLLFGRNKAGLTSLLDRDHGGAPGAGRGAVWVREVLAQYEIDCIARLELLSQPRVLGHVFNPVSFWLCYDADGGLRAVISEVTNTYGDRHCYLSYHEDQRVITAADQLKSTKIFYVSPFQPITGEYRFRFDIQNDRINIRIDYSSGNGGLLATLSGRRKPLTNLGILKSMIRRPLGARRVLALIHWQALKLWWKGALFRNRPVPPNREISR